MAAAFWSLPCACSMVKKSTVSKNSGCDTLDTIIGRAFDGDQRATDLFQRFLNCRSYSRQFVLLLIDVARGTHRDTWQVRRLAILMLQEHLLALDASDTREFGFVLEQLGLKKGGPENRTLDRSVLKEGYASRDVASFIVEFRRRLRRPRCAVKPRSRRKITTDDVRAFVHQSQHECKLALGRYLLAPDEVADRIAAHVKVRTGLPLALDDGLLHEEAPPTIVDLPDYEASILRRLRSQTRAFWVADNTPSQLNALVEYPLGTVVLVVKPPGSHHEFQLKRAGRRGDQPLSARSHVPPSHRLDGGSMLAALKWDAKMTTVFDHIYRRVNGTPAPVSRIVNLVGIFDVPVLGGAVPMIEYFTKPQVFGAGYDAMRRAMAIVVDCFRAERGELISPIPGDYGLTMQFITFAGPAQAIVCGSSSFRLDLVARYLSDDGAAEYFTRGLEMKYDRLDAKMLVDDLLDEALGVYFPPNVEYQDHGQYVAAALSVPKNRTRANAVYGELLTQIGAMWGTLMAVRGYSFGESFVARNVGLRTIWSQGQWRVRLIFQDHDNLVVPESDQTQFCPLTALPPTEQDHRFIMGSDGSENLAFEFSSLRRIYRPDRALREKARRRFQSALKRAYVKTQKAMRSDRKVRRQFDERFIERLGDWDALARKYLARNGSSTCQGWKRRVRKYLENKGYGEDSIEQHCRALEVHGSFVEQYAFLYRAQSDVS